MYTYGRFVSNQRLMPELVLVYDWWQCQRRQQQGKRRKFPLRLPSRVQATKPTAVDIQRRIRFRWSYRDIQKVQVSWHWWNHPNHQLHNNQPSKYNQFFTNTILSCNIAYVFKDLLENSWCSRIIVPSVNQFDEDFIELIDQNGTFFNSINANDDCANQL